MLNRYEYLAAKVERSFEGQIEVCWISQIITVATHEHMILTKIKQSL